MLFLAILSVSNILLVNGNPGHNACCYPPQMEGVRDDLETMTSKYFAINYGDGLMYETEDLSPGSSEYWITDLANAKRYHITGNKCRESELANPALYSRCFNGNHMEKGMARLGTEFDNLNVDTFEYRNPHETVFRATTLAANECFPVFTYSNIRGDISTSVYYNVHDTVSDSNLLTIPESCSRSGGGSSGSSSDEDD